MGCDIHSYAEKQQNGEWIALDVVAFDHRNYGFFGWLADVRNYSSVKPIAARRGLPKDASNSAKNEFESWGYDAHSVSWVSMSELLSIDYDSYIEDRRVMVQLGPNHWTGAATCDQGKGGSLTLREFLGKSFFDSLERLKKSGADRVIFWFDN